LEGAGIADLESQLKQLLPLGPRLYPREYLTDRPERFVIGELIREQAYLCLHNEIPHAVAVLVDEVAERPDGPMYVAATLFIERDSQKRIVIGSGGSMIKRIGEAARGKVEALLAHKVFLDLHVKTRRHWRRNPADLQRFGYK
jgi:GTP-binding protein Era